MRFRADGIDGLVVIEPEHRRDARGSFARTWCREDFAAHGIEVDFVQANTSFNNRRGTLRGLHFQAAPFEEAKLVRCARGRIYDIALDIRPGSPTFGQWAGIELTAYDGRAVFSPEGFAHGFQTLEDDCEVFYQMSAPYHAEAASGVRWNDPTLGIVWPVSEPILSERDATLPSLDEAIPMPRLAEIVELRR